MDSPVMIENRVFKDIAVGETASLTRTLMPDDIALFATVSGDVDPALTATDLFQTIIAHGMWGSSLIAAVLGTELPGPGTIYLGQSLRFLRPVVPGDTITASVTVTAKKEPFGQLTLACQCVNQRGEDVITGEAQVKAPTEQVSRPRIVPPQIRIMRHEGTRRLLDSARIGTPLVAAVAHPCDPSAIAGAVEAADAGFITPVLVGPVPKIHAAAEAAGLSILGLRIIDVPHSHAAAAAAVGLVSSGEAQLLIKGALHTDELMSAVLAPDAHLRTERRISHVYLMDVPGYPRPLLVTDAAINIEPTLAEKADIIRNAIGLAHVIGITCPRVAILAAVETVNPAMRSTLDAAALCKMADRGQISGAHLDGPLAFDNAINEGAAEEKGIISVVAGRADILVAPNLEAGNMIAKQLTFLTGADAAGIVLGARVPIVLTSRADSVGTRLASAALAVLVARANAAAAKPVA